MRHNFPILDDTGQAPARAIALFHVNLFRGELFYTAKKTFAYYSCDGCPASGLVGPGRGPMLLQSCQNVLGIQGMGP